MPPRLLNTFERDGYVVLPAVFDADEVAAMRRDADFILELIINSSLPTHAKSSLDIPASDGTRVVRKISDHATSPCNSPKHPRRPAAQADGGPDG